MDCATTERKFALVGDTKTITQRRCAKVLIFFLLASLSESKAHLSVVCVRVWHTTGHANSRCSVWPSYTFIDRVCGAPFCRSLPPRVTQFADELHAFFFKSCVCIVQNKKHICPHCLVHTREQITKYNDVTKKIKNKKHKLH